MIQKCKVSSIDTSGIRAILTDKDDAVTPPLSKALHVGELEIGDMVAVIFFDNLSDGLIIAKCGG